MNKNIIVETDGYKVSHYKQYPSDVVGVYSYLESRGGRSNETVFFGLQHLLYRLEGNVVHKRHIDEAEDIFESYMPGQFNRSGWERIVSLHEGRLPVRIKALSEGTVAPIGTPLITVENTDDKLPWLTNYLETILTHVWSPITVATYSRDCKKVLKRYLELSADNQDGLDFMLHDFGYRGCSSQETAELAGAAHLLNFLGTDTVPAISLLNECYYGRDSDIVGVSIPASEHSTITSWGEKNESEAYRNMLRSYPTGTIACVSDSFNIFRACSDIWGGELRDDVLARDGALVIRPDSGDPHEVLPEILSTLGHKFGQEVNSKGFKVLNPKVRVIQGDGVDIDTIDSILKALTNLGWSAENIAFGSGGALLQQHTRDEQKFAFKCSSVRLSNGEHRDVFKSPITDIGKASKRGRFKVVEGDNGIETVQEADPRDDLLRVVFENGEMQNETTLDAIRSSCKL